MGIFSEKNRKLSVFGAVFALGLYLGFQYLLPLAGPFVPAFLAVYLTAPVLERAACRLRVDRFGLSRPVLFVLLVLLISGVLGIAGWLLLRQGGTRVSGLYRHSEQMAGQMESWICSGCGLLEEVLGMESGEVQQILVEKLNVFTRQLQVNLWPTAARQGVAWVKNLGKAGAFWGIGMIAAVLLCKDYEKIEKRMKETPLSSLIWQFWQKMVGMVTGYVKAQLVIIGVIAGISALGLWITGVEGGIVWGLMAGLLDALPFVGTGAVLLPLALWQLLNQNFGRMALILVCFVLCITVRELLEPRLLGKQLGIPPVIMLLSVYAGVKVFGISGLFLGPLYVMFWLEGVRMYRRISDQPQNPEQEQPESQSDGA